MTRTDHGTEGKTRDTHHYIALGGRAETVASSSLAAAGRPWPPPAPFDGSAACACGGLGVATTRATPGGSISAADAAPLARAKAGRKWRHAGHLLRPHRRSELRRGAGDRRLPNELHHLLGLENGRVISFGPGNDAEEKEHIARKGGWRRCLRGGVAIELRELRRLLDTFVLIKPSARSPFQRGLAARQLPRSTCVRVGFVYSQGAFGRIGDLCQPRWSVMRHGAGDGVGGSFRSSLRGGRYDRPDAGRIKPVRGEPLREEAKKRVLGEQIAHSFFDFVDLDEFPVTGFKIMDVRVEGFGFGQRLRLLGQLADGGFEDNSCICT